MNSVLGYIHELITRNTLSLVFCTQTKGNKCDVLMMNDLRVTGFPHQEVIFV